jgi:hypothetical protein
MAFRVFLKNFSYALTITIILIFGFFWSSQAHAQVSGATLTGTVKDASESIIPNAQVSITDVATGVIRTVLSDNAGLYTAPNLLPGTYEIRVTATGFSTHVQRGLTLTVGAQQVLDITMQVGQVSQTVEITTEAPTIELTSSTISAEVNATTVRELPLNGRSWTDLAALQPGVGQINTMQSFNNGGAGRGNRGFGSELTVSGARPMQNNYRLDGVSINDYSNGSGSVLGGTLGVDAIQEFTVLTGSFSAEYGKTAGGVVNATTRSGTNQFHGDVYEFLRNSALDARNFFDPTKIPPFRRNQFGASAGGPIQKDRTFIFGDYEGIRQALGLTQIDFVPSATARTGNVAGTTVTVDPAAQKFLAFWPLPNNGLVNADVGRLAVPINQNTSENFFTIRVDRKFSEKDSIFGTYLFDETPYTAPDAFSHVLLGDTTFRQVIAIEESHTFNTNFVNSIRFGFNRDFVNNTSPVAAITPLATDKSFAAVPGQNAPIINIGGGLTLMPGGLNATPLYHYRWNAFQGFDDAFLTKGLHSLKFGVAFERDQDNQLTAGGLPGNWTFSSLQNFLTNHPSKFTATLPGFESERGVRQSILGIYAQDDWRVRPNLTLNLGLRYEMSTVPTEVQGKLSNLINVTDATPHLGDPFFLNPTLRNFEPRVGFSWDPFRNGKTAVRGGFGEFDVLPLLYQFLTLNGQAAPFRESGSTSAVGPGSFPTGGLALLVPTSLQYINIEHQPKRNYVMQWNLNVQRQITPTLTATIGYVGSRGVHNPFRDDDVDIVVPTLTSAGYLFPPPIGKGARLNPNAGTVRYVRYEGGSEYDDLEVGIQKRMSHGFQLQGSFTWAKSIDNSSSVVAGNAFATSISSPDWYDLRLDRAVSDFNVPRSLVINGTWLVPGWKSATGPAALITNGWQLGAIFRANDGSPFTLTWGSGGDPAGTRSSDVTYGYPNRLTGPGCETLVNPGNPNDYIKYSCFALSTAPNMAFWQANCDTTSKIYGNPKIAEPFPVCFNLRGNAGRNIAYGPGLTDVDFSLFKNNYVKRISETFNIQFRTEFFNILNHANFTPPIIPSDIFASNGTPLTTAGVLSSTVTTAREIQFAVKVSW